MSATLGPCAKKIVECTILGSDGRRYVGRNDCANPQEVCPRGPKDDYTLCVSLCRQPGHAEVMALEAAGDAARGGIAFITGVGHVCDACDLRMAEAGIAAWALMPPPPLRACDYRAITDAPAAGLVGAE